MTALTILEAGPATTVQDLGRAGMQRYGVAGGGAMDRSAHAEGAALLDQSPTLASVEMGLLGGRFQVDRDLVVAVTGAEASVTAGDEKVADNQTIHLRAGARLQIGPARNGTYTYLSVRGGVAVPTVLGSRSTHVRAGLGGLDGRNLVVGDRLPIGEMTTLTSDSRLVHSDPPTGPIRVVWAQHAYLFEETSRENFLASTFIMSSERDRMGARLDGASPILADGMLRLPSSPVVAGDIQVPGDGRPVVLLADRQPTGGYPRIATIVTADLDRFAQIPSGNDLRFEAIDVAGAHDLLVNYLRRIAAIPTVPVSRRADPSLWGENLITGFIVGDEETN